MFGRMLAFSGLMDLFSKGAINLPLPNIAIIGVLLVTFLVLGTVIDSISIMVITLPIMLPVVTALGYDLIWFGIVAVLAIEVGLLTPPFGMVVFVIKAAIGEEAEVHDIFRGSVPFTIMILATLVILIFFPILSTWLPSLM